MRRGKVRSECVPSLPELPRNRDSFLGKSRRNMRGSGKRGDEMNDKNPVLYHGAFRERIKEYIESVAVRLDDDCIPHSAVVELLKEFSDQLFNDSVRSLCPFCRRGNIPVRRPFGARYQHRVNEGKGGRLIWTPCRVVELWIMAATKATSSDSQRSGD